MKFGHAVREFVEHTVITVWLEYVKVSSESAFCRIYYCADGSQRSTWYEVSQARYDEVIVSFMLYNRY